MNKDDIFEIVGAGGFGREVQWLCRRLGYSVPLLTTSVELINTIDLGKPYAIAIGNPGIRKIVQTVDIPASWYPVNLIDPSAIIGDQFTSMEGLIVCAGTIITVNVAIGRFVHINLACTVGHDVEIGDFVTVSPGVNISGNVKIGDCSFIGTGAKIIEGVSVGKNSVIAAGAVVTKDVPDNVMVAGIPAIIKKELT